MKPPTDHSSPGNSIGPLGLPGKHRGWEVSESLQSCCLGLGRSGAKARGSQDPSYDNLGVQLPLSRPQAVLCSEMAVVSGHVPSTCVSPHTSHAGRKKKQKQEALREADVKRQGCGEAGYKDVGRKVEGNGSEAQR